MSKNRLVVSEMFYSLQGEGPATGHPAVFLRLAACNLSCEGFSYRDPTSGEHLGCDTKHVWKKGKPYTFEEILMCWEEEGWMKKLAQGAHLVITGGEPLLQGEALETFLKSPLPLRERSREARVRGNVKDTPHPLDSLCESHDLSHKGRGVYLELETNGSILPNTFLSQRIHQFNVSPKLTSSKELREKAYQEKVLAHFAALPQAIFKFVIQTEKDVEEVIERYQKVFELAPTRIWLMPEGGTRATLQPKMAMVADACKTFGFNFSPRLHIHLWDEATGV